MIEACPDPIRRMPMALSMCQRVMLRPDASNSAPHWWRGTRTLCFKKKAMPKVKTAAVGATSPRKVQGGISLRAIFRNGQAVPQPIMTSINKR